MGSGADLDAAVWTVTEFGLVAARCLLAATFLLAGLAKLANKEASVQALRGFGAPRFMDPFMPWLPRVEIAVAAGLLFALSAWYAAWAAAALLAVFIAAIAANLVRGLRPPCNCFGQLHAKPISWWTLVRNGVLAACATWIIVSGPPQAAADVWVLLSYIDKTRRALVLVAAAIGLILLYRLWQEEEPDAEALFADESESSATPHRTAAVASEADESRDWQPASGKTLTGNGLAIGTAAPPFAIPDLEGQLHSLEALRASGKPVLLVFSSPNCQSCQALVPKLPAQAALHEDAFRMVLISRGTARQNLAKIGDPGKLLVLLQQRYEVAEAYDSTSSPAAVVVDTDGVIQSRLAIGAPAIAELIASQSHSSAGTERAERLPTH